MRTTAEVFMRDECQRIAWSEPRDADNQEGSAYQDAETFPSSFIAGSTKETPQGVVTIEDRVRLPLSAAGVFSHRDHIKITKIRGVPVAEPKERAIDGDPTPILSSLVILLKGVHT
jgi:hypothetical protein